jgi:serine kinase of HPr protein (carbohydrate metabolism regulator)
MRRLHATCVLLAGTGVLLRGPSGSGKSDLALRLIDGGGRLVADDQVLVEARDGALFARAPASLHGLLEVRGLGILRLGAEAEAPLSLLVDLVPEGAVERLPEPASEDLLGVALPRLALHAFHASAPAKLRLAASMSGAGAGAAAPPAGRPGMEAGALAGAAAP